MRASELVMTLAKKESSILDYLYQKLSSKQFRQVQPRIEQVNRFTSQVGIEVVFPELVVEITIRARPLIQADEA